MRFRSPPPAARDIELHAFATTWQERGADREPAEILRARLAAELTPRYLEAGLHPPSMIWCDGPTAFRQAVADPPSSGRRWVPAPVSTAAALFWLGAWMLIVIVAVAVLAGAAAGVVIGALAGVNLLLVRALASAGLPVAEDSAAGTGLFIALMISGLIGLLLLLPRLIALPVLAGIRVMAMRPPRWFDDVSARLAAADPTGRARTGRERAGRGWGGLTGDEVVEPAAVIWATLRGAVIALAPPARLSVEELDGHTVLEVLWADGDRAVFVDAERVPRRPVPGSAGRQAEAFARQWVSLNLGPATDPQLRPDIEAAVRDCFRLLGLRAPSMRWCATPDEYEQAVGQPRRTPTSAVGARLWTAAHEELQSADIGGRNGQAILAVVAEAGGHWHPWRPRRILAAGTTAQWRWARMVRTGEDALAAPTPGPAGDLLTAAERTERVAWIATSNQVVLLAPPMSIERGELRSADPDLPLLETATITWSDGSQWHLCHGTRVPRPAESGDWTAAEITAVPNTEVRRVLIESIGWDAYLEQAQLPLIGEAPDPANPPHRLQLFGFDDLAWATRRLLVMTNASPGRDGAIRRFAEFVPGHIDDPVEAAAWQYGVPVEVYRMMERRT